MAKEETAWDLRPFALMLAILVGSAYPGVLTGQSAFFFRDYGYFGHPIAAHLEASLRQGELPLWNPLSNCGIPFLAQWNTMVLYPGMWLAALVGMIPGLGWFCLGHQWLGGIGMFLLARDWTQNRQAAWFVGIGFALAGLIQTSLMWPNNIAAFAWMPWMVRLAVQKDSSKPWHWAAWVGTGTLQMLTGAPEVIAMTWILMAGICLVDSAGPKLGTRIGRFIGGGLAVAGLSACQLIPFLELLHVSQRDASYGGNDWSMPATGWANFFVPLFHSFSKYFGVPSLYGQYWTASYYPGVVCIALAITAVLVRGDRRIPLLALFTVLAGVLALGDAGGLYIGLRKLVPSLGLFRYPVKWVILMTFTLPLLAAFGWAALADTSTSSASKKQALIWTTLGIAILIVGITTFGVLHPFRKDLDLPLSSNGVIRLLALMLGCASIWFGLVKKQWNSRATGIALVVALAVQALDLRHHVPELNPTANPAIYHKDVFTRAGISNSTPLVNGRLMTLPSAAAQAQVAVHGSPESDYLTSRRLLLSNCNLVDRLPKVDGLFSLYLRDMDWINRELLYRHQTLPQERKGFLNFLGVSAYAVMENGKPGWIQREGPRPLVSIGMAPRYLEETQIRAALLRGDFEPDREILLSAAEKDRIRAEPDSGAKVSSVKSSNHDILFTTESGKQVLVSIAQAWHPAWRVEIDGRETPMLKGNLGFQAFEVPAGTHKVRVYYSANSLKLGLILGFVTACIVLYCFRRSVEKFSADRSGN